MGRWGERGRKKKDGRRGTEEGEFLSPKSHGIPRDTAEFRVGSHTEFRLLPRNFGYFRIVYGIYEIKKNIRNSVSAEFRKHPTNNVQ